MSLLKSQDGSDVMPAAPIPPSRPDSRPTEAIVPNSSSLLDGPTENSDDTVTPPTSEDDTFGDFTRVKDDVERPTKPSKAAPKALPEAKKDDVDAGPDDLFDIDKLNEAVKEEKKEPESENKFSDLQVFNERFVAKKKVGRDVEEFVVSKLKRLEVAERDASKLKADFLELQNRQSEAKDTFWNHPEAYTLHPDFVQAQSAANTADLEVRFWQRQLEAIEDGKPFRRLIVTKEGYSQSDEQEPSAQAKVAILTHLQKLSASQMRAQEQLQFVQQHHTTEHKRVVEFVGGVVNKFLKPYAEASPNSQAAQSKASLDKMMPVALKNNPLYPLVTNLYAAIRDLQSSLHKTKSKATVQKVLSDEAIQLEPTQRELEAKGGTKKRLSFDDEDFDVMGEFERRKDQ